MVVDWIYNISEEMTFKLRPEEVEINFLHWGKVILCSRRHTIRAKILRQDAISMVGLENERRPLCP